MGNELALSSDNRIVEKTIWINGIQEKQELELSKNDDPKDFYYVYLRGESSYIISQSSFNRIQNAIGEGAKFVRINYDLVNVNEIKRFKKAK
jgi:hypothetical protein